MRMVVDVVRSFENCSIWRELRLGGYFVHFSGTVHSFFISLLFSKNVFRDCSSWILNTSSNISRSSEAANHRCSAEYLKILKNFAQTHRETPSDDVIFGKAAKLSCDFHEIIQYTFVTEHLQETTVSFLPAFAILNSSS